MAATLIGLVYGTASLTARRVIIPDDIDGDAYLDKVIVPPGMALVKVPRASLPQVKGGPSAFLSDLLPVASQILGQTITQQKRHVVVDANNVVVDVWIVDPLLVPAPQAATPDMTSQLASLQIPVTPKGPFVFIQHDTAIPGGTLINGVFTASVLAAPIVTSPL